MPPAIPWFIAVLSTCALVAVLLSPWYRRTNRRRRRRPPEQWPLTPRPVFDNAERIVYRHLRTALPTQVILAKLPLIRFCQPADPREMAYWFELLGAAHVSFAVCSPSGRVLIAVDLYSDRVSRRTVQVKASVLAACRVPHLYAAPGALPSVRELQALVPQPATGDGTDPPVHADGAAGTATEDTPGPADDGQLPLWQDAATMTDLRTTLPAGTLPVAPPLGSAASSHPASTRRGGPTAPPPGRA